MLANILSYGAGTLIAIVLVAVLGFVFISDITQKKHGVLRNYPVVGHLRYFFEEIGEYFRQYFFAGDRDEMPFNRATRGWVYRLAKNEGGVIGFGSTYDLHAPGALIFVNHPFPVLEEERLPTPSLMLGEGYCREPFEARSIVNVSGMSFGAISAPAVRSLSRGANVAGCWMDTGEGGLSPYHLEGGCDIIMQIGTAKYGVRDAQGNLSAERLRGARPRSSRHSRSSCRRARSPARAACCPAPRSPPRSRRSAAFPKAATRSARTAIATSPT